MKVAIVGAGLSGLSLAYFLSKRQDVHKIDVFEKESEPGGLLRTVNGQDLGPHYIFGDQEAVGYILNDFLHGEFKQVPHSKTAYNKFGMKTKFPFQFNLQDLPDEMREHALEGYETRPRHFPTSFADSFICRFGNVIWDMNMMPYNIKMWGKDLMWKMRPLVGRMFSDSIKIRNEESYGMPVSFQSKSGLSYEIIMGLIDLLDVSGKYFIYTNAKRVVQSLLDNSKDYTYIINTTCPDESLHKVSIYIDKKPFFMDDEEVCAVADPSLPYYRVSKTYDGEYMYESRELPENFQKLIAKDLPAYPLCGMLKRSEFTCEVIQKGKLINHGRLGRNMYWNMDQCVKESLKLAKEL